MNRRLVQLLPVVLLIALAGCGGGSGVGLDENGNPVGGGPPAQLTPTLASIQQNIFTPSCGFSGCHAPGTAPFGLRLDTAAMSGQLLVNVASFELPSLMRVSPNDPDNSFLVQKIEGTATAGGRMPLNRTPLTAQQIQVIRDWISNGASISSQTDETQSVQKQVEIVDLATLQRTVFTPHCISCHSGDAPAAELDLEAGESYRNLVNVSRFPDDYRYPVRIVPGDADNSFLVRKLEGKLTPEEGVQMPLSQPALDSTLIDKVREWITNGAKP